MAGRRPSHRGRKTGPKPRRETLTIDRLGGSGDGLAGDIAVPFTLPGEVVEADVRGREATLSGFVEASSIRQPSACSHFGLPGDACGGCQLQHLGLAGSLEWKRDHLVAALGRTLDHVPAPELLLTDLNTRRRAKLALKRQGKGWVIGFRRRRSHTVVNMRDCAVLHPDLLATAFALREAAGSLLPAGTVEAEAFLTRTDTGIDLDLSGIDETALTLEQREGLASFAEQQGLARLSVEGIAVAARQAPQMVFGGVPVSLNPGGFLQATADGEEGMQSVVTAAARDAKAIADLFCGSGTFALPLSSIAPVEAFDSEAGAITALAAAAGCAGRPVTARRRDLFDDPLTANELAAFDTIVLDPPRAGAKAQMAEIADSGAQTVIAVSCNPETLSRDVALLAGLYDLSQLTLVDQFLFTPHIECVAVFRRNP